MNISSLFKFMPLWLLWAIFLHPHATHAQEIDARVTIDKSQITSTSLQFTDDLPQQIEAYINQHDWTSDEFGEEEKINMVLQINLLGVQNYNFEAQVIIRAQRPIYNSPRETVTLLFNDEDWTFEYRPNQTFIHDELQFNSLTSLLDFYVYLVMGYDADTFQEMGGTDHYQQAQNIVSLAQTSSAAGWSRTSSRRNRAQLITYLLQTNYQPFRTALYEYHRIGLDRFLDNPTEARQNILGALEKIQEAKRQTSSNLLFDTFFNAKYREITSIFEDADPKVRLEAYNLLSNIDQSHLSEYQKLQ